MRLGIITGLFDRESEYRIRSIVCLFYERLVLYDEWWLHPNVEPSDREPGTCYLDDPKTVNDGSVGMVRFCTLRSWLSQWSIDDAQCDAIISGAEISIPALVIGNTADDACTPSHTTRLYEAIGHDNKQIHMVKEAAHYHTDPNERWCSLWCAIAF